MARELMLRMGPESYSLAPVKVERRKIYGWTELRVIDSNGEVCRNASLDSNGVTVIPAGATKIGMVDDDGKWMDKSELRPVHSDGTEAELIPSSFESGIVLEKKATAEEYLDLITTSVYVLNGEGAEDLAKKIGDDIFSFRFNYTADYEDSPAFLISNGEAVFIITGQNAKYEYLSLEEKSDLDIDEEETDECDLDDLDFNMM